MTGETSGTRRPTGYGKIVNEPPTEMPELLHGEGDTSPKQGKYPSVNPDAKYAGNVAGCNPKSFVGD